MPTGGAIAVETCNATLDDAHIAQEIGVPPGNFVRVTVSDTGVGMAPAVRDRALEPFFTTKPDGKGTGLGLSMVYGFVRQSGGHVTIHSEIGAGTTISLYFPAVADTAATDASGGAAGPVPTLGAAQLVLVVDDDPRVLRLSAARLAAFGFTCISATTADEAWTILQDRGDITLVFTDLVMPGRMSGHDLARRILAEKPGVKVLMTSFKRSWGCWQRRSRQQPQPRSAYSCLIPDFDGAILSSEWRENRGSGSSRERHDDSGSPSCDTAWSREPEEAGEAIRAKKRARTGSRSNGASAV